MSHRDVSEEQRLVEASTFIACFVFLTYLALAGAALMGMVPAWFWFLAMPLHFVGGMAYEQAKYREDGPPQN